MLSRKETNINFIKIDKFYEFIIKNKNKISEKKRKDYLEAIMSYGNHTIFDYTKESLCDYAFIPLIHENEYPELIKDKSFFSNLTKYKEQIFNFEVPFNSSKIIKSLSPENKKELLINFIKNYKVESYNNTAHSII